MKWSTAMEPLSHANRLTCRSGKSGRNFWRFISDENWIARPAEDSDEFPWLEALVFKPERAVKEQR